MVGQLHFQATLQGGFQHALQQPVIAAQRHLAGIDLLKNLVQPTRCLQPISQLPLACTPLSALRVLHRGHRDSGVLSTRWTTAYTRSDTSQIVVIDPSAPYASGIRAALPDAKIAVDKWHLVALANQMVTEVRHASHATCWAGAAPSPTRSG